MIAPDTANVVAQVLTLQSRVDCFGAGVWAEQMATAMGWELRDAGELSILVGELCTNAVRHGGGGECSLLITPLSALVDVLDRGPGFAADVLDGTRKPEPGVLPERGLGEGLASVRRLADEVFLENAGAGGAHVCAKRRARFTRKDAKV